MKRFQINKKKTRHIESSYHGQHGDGVPCKDYSNIIQTTNLQSCVIWHKKNLKSSFPIFCHILPWGGYQELGGGDLLIFPISSSRSVHTQLPQKTSETDHIVINICVLHKFKTSDCNYTIKFKIILQGFFPSTVSVKMHYSHSTKNFQRLAENFLVH